VDEDEDEEEDGGDNKDGDDEDDSNEDEKRSLTTATNTSAMTEVGADDAFFHTSSLMIAENGSPRLLPKINANTMKICLRVDAPLAIAASVQIKYRKLRALSWWRRFDRTLEAPR